MTAENEENGLNGKQARSAVSAQDGRAVDGERTVADHAKGWLSATKDRAQALTELAFAEARLAAVSVAMMAFFGVLAAVFVLGAWGLLIAALVQLLTAQGIAAWLVMGVLALVHIVAAFLFWRAIMKLSSNVEFTATREQLTGKETRH